MIKKVKLVVSDKILNEDMCILAERHQQTVNAYLSVYPNSHIISTNIINEVIITVIEDEVKTCENVYNTKEMNRIVDITTRFIIDGQTRSLYTTIHYK